MINLKSKNTVLAVAGAFIIDLPLYGYYAMRSHFEGRVNALESEVQALRSQSTTKVQELSADLNYIAEKMDIKSKFIIQKLISKGILASINQTLDLDVAKDPVPGGGPFLRFGRTGGTHYPTLVAVDALRLFSSSKNISNSCGVIGR